MKQIQLFLLHFAGGNRYSFRFLEPYLQDFTLIPLELPGRGGRYNEPLLKDLELAAADICRQISSQVTSDYIIYGHSMGAQLALKVASDMEVTGLPPLSIIVSGNAGPGVRPAMNRHLLERALFKNELKEMGGVPPEFLENEELYDFYEPILRADFELVEKSCTLDFKPLGIPIYALMGSEELYSGQIANWGKFTSAPALTRLLSGGHFFIHQHPKELATVIKSGIIKTDRTIAGCLEQRAAYFPAKTAFCYLEDGEEKEINCTYGALNESVRNLAVLLRKSGLSGHPVVLLYPEGLAFIIAFMACQQADVIAVPMFLPRGSRHMDRLYHILTDAGASVILSSLKIGDKLEKELLAYQAEIPIKVILTDDPAIFTKGTSLLMQPIPDNEIAFIQYTSGSTGAPKGVVIKHGNLLNNQLLLANTFGGNSNSIILSWLPFYHDMGLIGNILHTLYIGATCILMAPFHFIQQPLRWLKAISKYKVTHSGGPNFSYDLCVDKIAAADIATLDLSSWKVAYNGSEPVKTATMDRFAANFAGTGFKSDSFFPCYGLAEATLLVSGIKDSALVLTISVEREALNGGYLNLAAPGDERFSDVKLVSSGKIPAGMHVKILGAAEDRCIGEILIRGASVSSGYWKQLDSSMGQKDHYLPTGDLGFIYEHQLFVTGRKKEMLIIRGQNYYPYDIENSCNLAHPAIEKNAIVALAADIHGQEELVLIVEVKRTFIKNINTGEVKNAIRNKVIEATGLAPHAIVLVNPHVIPRTPSGKLQRNQCTSLYAEDGFLKVTIEDAAHTAVNEVSIQADFIEQVKKEKDPDLILKYLELLFQHRLHNSKLILKKEEELAAIGIDSLRAMELVNAMNRDLNINLDATRIFQINTVGGLVITIETILRITDVKLTQSDKEIFL